MVSSWKLCQKTISVRLVEMLKDQGVKNNGLTFLWPPALLAVLSRCATLRSGTRLATNTTAFRGEMLRVKAEGNLLMTEWAG